MRCPPFFCHSNITDKNRKCFHESKRHFKCQFQSISPSATGLPRPVRERPCKAKPRIPQSSGGGLRGFRKTEILPKSQSIFRFHPSDTPNGLTVPHYWPGRVWAISLDRAASHLFMFPCNVCGISSEPWRTKRKHVWNKALAPGRGNRLEGANMTAEKLPHSAPVAVSVSSFKGCPT